MIDILFGNKHRLDYRKILDDIGVKNPEECMQWSFGDNWKALGLRKAMLSWHERNGGNFPLKGNEDYESLIKKAGQAYVYYDKEPFLKIDHLYDLDQLEKAFRRIMVKSFKLEGIHDANEMMDCISWGLNYNKSLLHCHSYWRWPDEFFKNTGIMVNRSDTVTKCIRLLARKWKSKKKVYIARGINAN